MNLITYLALIGILSLIFNSLFDNMMFRLVSVFCLAVIVGQTLYEKW